MTNAVLFFDAPRAFYEDTFIQILLFHLQCVEQSLFLEKYGLAYRIYRRCKKLSSSIIILFLQEARY